MPPLLKCGSSAGDETGAAAAVKNQPNYRSAAPRSTRAGPQKRPLDDALSASSRFDLRPIGPSLIFKRFRPSVRCAGLFLRVLRFDLDDHAEFLARVVCLLGDELVGSDRPPVADNPSPRSLAPGILHAR